MSTFLCVVVLFIIAFSLGMTVGIVMEKRNKWY